MPDPELAAALDAFTRGTRHGAVRGWFDPASPGYDAALVAERRAAVLAAAARFSGAAAAEPAPRPDGPAPGAEAPARDPERQLVVARFKENLSWLARSPVPALVYCMNPACQDKRHVHLPDRRREAGPYLQFIVTNYDDLPELTYFCQGNPFDHSPDFLERIRFGYDRPTSLAPRYTADHPPAEVKDQDRVERVHGFEVRYGDALAGGHSHGKGHGWYNPAMWPYLFDCPMPRPLWFGYGATWAVPRECITRRPLALWQHLLDVCHSGAGLDNGNLWTDPPVNPWTMEASWYYLFADPKLYPHRREFNRADPRPSASEAAGLIRAAKACPHRKTDAPGCGCNTAVCLAGKGGVGGKVYLADCTGCVRSQQ